MNFNQFVVRNTLRNKHLYMAYFLSTLFTVMTFFTFAVFAFHPIFAKGLNTGVRVGMLSAAAIIYIFSFFFVLYSMDVFIQSRKKEFGVLMIQGMSPKQLRKMIFIENLVIGFFATILGSLLGILFSQVILWLSDTFMHIQLAFYFPTQGIILTLVSFSVLFLAISVFVRFRLPKASVQELLKAGELGKGTLKPSLFKGILAIILLAVGYITAFIAKGTMIILVMMPVIVVVIIGTRFLFNQLSISIIEGLKKKTTIFWKKTNLVVLSDLSFRMKDNARSFFLVSIISTVAFVAIGTLYSFQQMLLDGNKQIPYEFSLSDTSGENKEIQQKFTQFLQENKVEVEQVSYNSYTDQQGHHFVSEREYNQLAKLTHQKSIKINKGEAIQLIYDHTLGEKKEKIQTLLLPNKAKVVIKEHLETTLFPGYENYFVVKDTKDMTNLDHQQTTAWEPTKLSYNEKVKIGEFSKNAPGLVAKSYTIQSVMDFYKPILFVGIFIGIIFFVSAGSFLYFRLYSDMAMDVEKFKMVYKLGVTKKEMKKMVYQQVGILFFTPIIVSIVHGIVALTAMFHVFEQGMQLSGWQVLGVFLLIQLVYYLIARTFYFKKVYQQVVQTS